jgi:hypothetical protein
MITVGKSVNWSLSQVIQTNCERHYEDAQGTQNTKLLPSITLAVLKRR